MAPQQIQWGTITLYLDNKAFRGGFLAARQWHFQDIYGEDGHSPGEAHYAVELTSEEVLRLVVMPDEFDEMGIDHLAEYLGYLMGYLGGPLAPDEAAHYRNQQAQPEYLCSNVRG